MERVPRGGVLHVPQLNTYQLNSSQPFPGMTTILLAGGGTGGHAMPALYLADEIRRQRPDVEPVLVGAQRGIEAALFAARPFRFHLLPTEPIYRRQWWRNVRWLAVLPRVLRGAARVLDDEGPAVVIGTGGYASGPVLWAAARRGIPIVLHEQNAFPGVTTRRLAARAAQIHLGFPEARARLTPGPHTAVHAFGNPVPPAPTVDRGAARRALGIAPDARVLFVVGGSQGSRALNEVVGACLERGMLQDVTLLWGTGRAHQDAWSRFDDPPRRIVRGFWDPIAEPLAAADLAVSRAGAMTVAELAGWGLPAVFVPLPTAAADHQTVNARALVDAGAGVLMPEADLSADRLAGDVTRLLGDRTGLAAMADRIRERGSRDAVRYIVESVLGLVTA